MSGIRTLVGISGAGFVIVSAFAGDDRGAAMSLVDVTGADGMPAKGAMVAALPMGGFGMHGTWSEPIREFSMTDANGRAALASQRDPTCLFAYRGEEAALKCAAKNVSAAGATAIYELRLEAATTISGRVLGADGKRVAGVRLRLAIAGEQEWHFVDSEITEDGRFRLPPVPSRLLRTPDTHIEARAPECVEAHVAIDGKVAAAPVEVRFARARALRGKLHAAEAIRDATVRSSDKWHGQQARPGADGAFTLDGVSPETRRLYVTSRSHATRVVEVPKGASDADLGAIELEPGRAVNGRILGPDGGKGGTLTVGLVDDQGFELATMDTDVRAVFDFAHVGDSADHLVARSGGAGGELWVFERGKLAGEMPAPPFVVRFQDASGRPNLVEVARLVWTGGGKTETSIVRMVSYTLGVRAVRLRLPGPGSLRVEIEGRAPVVIDKVDVASDGTGEAVVTVPR